MISVEPPESFTGDGVRDDLHAAGFTDAEVVFVDGTLNISGVGEDDQAQVEQVVSAHVPPSPPPDPNEELRQAIAAASSWQQLQAALLGAGGVAVVAGRAKP